MNYRIGSSFQLGPGAFPVIVSILLVVVGAAQIIRAVFSGGEAALQIDVRSISSIVGALVFAGLTVKGLGIIVAIPGAVILSSLASGSARLLPTLLMAAFLTAFAYLVFVVGLGIQLSLLPEALQ
ncbi:Tripartite tricarboxylate transporter TctB family [Microvirga lotononidis]|uniref:Tripartite tricarboxylate transporter TctB family n=2 Tax=Microvirga lotononidis TaxID=864069 RepID=I4Z1M1_9HYPH|nr:Tripartite tricarboxylate transporter TctB family [Microvirga lotononidis]